MTCVAVSEDGRWVVSGSRDGTAVVWEVVCQEPSVRTKGLFSSILSAASGRPASVPARLTYKYTLSGGHDDALTSCDLCSVQQVGATASLDGTACLFSLEKGSLIAALQYDEDDDDGTSTTRVITLIKILPSGKIFSYCGDSKTLYLHSLDGTMICKAHDSEVSLGKQRKGHETTNTGDTRPAEKGGDAHITTVVVAWDQRLLVTGSSDGLLRFWSLEDLATRGEFQTLHRSAIRGLALACNNRQLLVGFSNGNLTVYPLLFSCAADHQQ